MRLTGRVVIIALIVTMTFAAPAASVGESREDWDWMRCRGAYDATFGCQALLRSAVEVVSCDDQNCTLNVNATFVGSANVPGWHQAHVYIVGGDQEGGLCIGIKQVREALADYAHCGVLCDVNTVGFQSGCSGKTKLNVTLPQGDSWTWFVVASIYDWNSYGGQAEPSIWFNMWRYDNGTIDIGSEGDHAFSDPQPRE